MLVACDRYWLRAIDVGSVCDRWWLCSESTGGSKALAEEMDLPFLGAIEMRADYMNSQKPASLESEAVGAEFTSISELLKAQIAAVKAG